MKFVNTELKFQILLIIALFSLLSQVTYINSIKQQITDFDTDAEIESIIRENDPTENNNLNPQENFFEDLNFLENSNLLRNATTPAAAPVNPIVDLTKPNVDFSAWLGVSNEHFNDPEYFPIGTKSTRKEVDFNNLSGNNFLVNQLYKPNGNPKVKNELMFFFRFKNGYIYYANTKESMNVIDSFKVDRIRNSETINSKISQSDTCFEVIDNKGWNWTLCSDNIAEKTKWLCSLEKLLKQKLDPVCGVKSTKTEAPKAMNTTSLYTNSTNKKIKKMFIIPKESRRCNEDWNYQNGGSDWECTCSEGINQSPINLPRPIPRMVTRMKPMFLYDIIQPINKENSIDGVMKENEPVKIYNQDGLLKIMHSNLGKIVMPDGGVYHGEEIIFHTPAEHMIAGKKFDMEIQVVHYGVSKGDIAKQVTLSFLFYMKPGVFNEFLDKIDVYNLPNEIDKFKDLTQSLNLPTIFYSNIHKDQYYENEQVPMKDFSFYQYEGSLTSPPCTERTTVIVAAEPLPISNTFVELFKEALRKPEYFGIDGKLYNAEDHPKLNARNVQPTNGRKINFYQSQLQGA